MLMRLAATALALAVMVPVIPANAAPGYDQGRKELEWVMEYLVKHLPGSWDSYPQVWFEQNVHMPTQEGEHEHWHRIFERIDAPQVGEVVFYGQVNVGGRDGPVLAGSQVLYHAVVDEELGAVNIFGQGPADPERFLNLHERPELWGEVQMRERAALNCDWLWRRDGNQIFGVLQGNTPEKQVYGPGTCSFMSSRADAEFRADAEWVLTPEVLWLYDNNWIAGMLFLGREDQTHLRLYRTRPYSCEIKDEDGERKVDGYDRGYKAAVTARDGRELELLLLRAEYPAADGFGLDDRLRLMLMDPSTEETLTSAEGDPLAEGIELEALGVDIDCERAESFPPMKLH